MRYRITAATLTAGALLALAACQASTPAGTSTGTSNAPALAGSSCHARTEQGQPLPDPTCTPGATNPAVTQADIGSTICRKGWTATIRPPVSYTDRLKRQGIAAYGYSDTRLSDFEEDHSTPLETGGSPTDPRNLWPEPIASARIKDKVENALNHAVCSGRVTLAAAQQAIASDWVTAEVKLGLQGSN